MRSSLTALALCLMIGGAEAAGPASTWSDPPTRKGEGGGPVAAAPAPAPPAKSAPAAVAASPGKGSDHHFSMAVPRRTHTATHRVRGKVRIAARAAPRRYHIVTARPPAPDVRAMRRSPFMATTYPPYRAVDFPRDYEDARLDRLGSAVRSGYLVMGRRTVVYPDGRVIHVYRPVDTGDDD